MIYWRTVATRSDSQYFATYFTEIVLPVSLHYSIMKEKSIVVSNPSSQPPQRLSQIRRHTELGGCPPAVSTLNTVCANSPCPGNCNALNLNQSTSTVGSSGDFRFTAPPATTVAFLPSSPSPSLPAKPLNLPLLKSKAGEIPAPVTGLGTK